MWDTPMPKSIAMTQQSATFQFTSILESHFNEAVQNVAFTLTNDLRQRFAPKQVLPVKEFPLDEYLAATELEPLENVKQRWKGGVFWAIWDTSDDNARKVKTEVDSGHLEISWQSVVIDVFKATWKHRYGDTESYYALVFNGETDSLGRDFFRAVATWNDSRTYEGMWVFDEGNWSKDKNLSAAIEGVTWDDLVLDANMVDRLRRDVGTFFDGEATYKALGVSWKRGLLLIGPPGNGKSHAIKILAKESPHPCLYVKSTKTSFGSRYGGYDSEYCIMQIFKMARKSAPCMLVLEDLDSLLGDATRSVFLNEVDGFANNHGILILASSNHPERIDVAIINRPSRFDVKYNFALPTRELRRRYAVKWFLKISKFGGSSGPSIKFSNHEALAEQVAKETEGFSYAFMKELFLGFLLSFAHSAGAIAPSEALLFQHVDELKEQIKRIPNEESNESKGDKEKAQTSAKGFSRALFFMRP